MTFCTKNHELYFGDVVDGRMELSEIGEYALQCIDKILEINDNVAVPEFVVMPNHIHMIVIIDNPIEWPDDEQLSQFDQRLPQWDSPTNPIENDNPDGGVVGLSYHGSRKTMCFHKRKKEDDHVILFSFVLIVIPYSPGVSAGASVGASVDWAGASVAGVVPIVAGASV